MVMRPEGVTVSKPEAQDWKRYGPVCGPSLWSGCPICLGGLLSSLERVCLDSFTSVDIEMAEHQETDWATFSFCFFLSFVGQSITPVLVCLYPGISPLPIGGMYRECDAPLRWRHRPERLPVNGPLMGPLLWG